jgi:hypothetical protein
MVRDSQVCFQSTKSTLSITLGRNVFFFSPKRFVFLPTGVGGLARMSPCLQATEGLLGGRRPGLPTSSPGPPPTTPRRLGVPLHRGLEVDRMAKQRPPCFYYQDSQTRTSSSDEIRLGQMSSVVESPLARVAASLVADLPMS